MLGTEGADTCNLVVDPVTKRLLRRVKPGDWLVICHDDLDEVAAEMIIDKQAGAVCNAGLMMSGRYPALGAKRLLQAGIPLYEISKQLFVQMKDAQASFRNEMLIVGTELQIACQPFTWRDWQERYRQAMSGQSERFAHFVGNTLDYAQREYKPYMRGVQWPPVMSMLANRVVLIVVRGSGYTRDLAALRTYINKHQPVLIAVDGGADALLEAGHVPHCIVGDMDSASDAALRSGAVLIVHAYADGGCPGMERIQALGLSASVVVAPGTSEDMAMNMAYDCGAAWIVAVGTHTHMLDFLEKGRQGMASTLLTRMRIGARLIDAKGYGVLFAPHQQHQAVSSERSIAEQMQPMLMEGTMDESLNYHTGLE